LAVTLSHKSKGLPHTILLVRHSIYTFQDLISVQMYKRIKQHTHVTSTQIDMDTWQWLKLRIERQGSIKRIFTAC
jgi:hypothetical protein